MVIFTCYTQLSLISMKIPLFGGFYKNWRFLWNFTILGEFLDFCGSGAAKALEFACIITVSAWSEAGSGNLVRSANYGKKVISMKVLAKSEKRWNFMKMSGIS